MPIEWCRGPMARLAPATHSAGMNVRVMQREIPALSSDLADFAAGLRDASARWNDAVRELVPATPAGVSISERYAHARRAWPADPPPSYEEIAALLAAVHEASSALRATAGRFDAAARVAARALRDEQP